MNMPYLRNNKRRVQKRRKISKAFCQSFYTSSLWVNHTQRAARVLRVQYNNIFRVLLRLPPYCSASQIFADARMDGYQAIIRKKDTMVVSNCTNILMDEEYYPDPYSFKPERFLADGKISLPDHYFPFGLAKHRCLGDVLGKCNFFVFTTTMLQRFSFLPAPDEPLPSLEHVDGATPSAAPFKALVVPRVFE